MAFTLLELLVVIAIIAVVAGLTFPVAQSSRQKGNQMSCLSNLQSIGQALRLYRMDEREYPPALYGYQEEGNRNQDGELEPTTFLYPHYVRAKREFKCPNNRKAADTEAATRIFDPDSREPQSAGPLRRSPLKGGGYELVPVTEKRIHYFVFDSYDGGFVPPKQDTDPSRWELHYRRDWASLYGASDKTGRELLDRNPEDSTFVTACTYHRTYEANGTPARSSQDMVLFQDGHVEKRFTSEMIVTGLFNWAVTPRE